jgi:hypothetical protein
MLSAQIRPARLVSLAAAAMLFAAVPLAARAADACSLLTKDQISAVANDPIATSSGVTNSCIWSGKKTTAYLGIRDGSTWSAAKTGAQKYGQAESASGVGDDAFFTPPNAPLPTLFAFKGGHFITVRLNVKGFSPDQTKAALKTLANDALGKL